MVMAAVTIVRIDDIDMDCTPTPTRTVADSPDTFRSIKLIYMALDIISFRMGLANRFNHVFLVYKNINIFQAMTNPEIF